MKSTEENKIGEVIKAVLIESIGSKLDDILDERLTEECGNEYTCFESGNATEFRNMIKQLVLNDLTKEFDALEEQKSFRIENCTVNFDRLQKATKTRPFMHIALRPDKSENELESKIWGKKRRILDYYDDSESYTRTKSEVYLIH